MKIVFLDAKTVGEVEEINDLAQFGMVELYPTTKPDQVLKRIKGAEVVITNKVVIDKKTIYKSPDLKLICVAATGMNNIDHAAAGEKGVKVMNVKGYSTDSVAQQTFAMLFYLLNQMSFYNSYVKSGKYSKSPIFTCIDKEITEIKGKVFGIIGLGAIGQRVAELAKAFGAKVIYYSTSSANNNSKYKRVDLHELLSTSDIISIHAPLNENTKGLIGKEEFKFTKSNCIVINTGRGGIIVEKELVNALNKKLISGAAIDVYEKEPISKTHVYYKVKEKERLVLTPHVAWASIEARRELVRRIALNISDFLENKNH